MTGFCSPDYTVYSLSLSRPEGEDCGRGEDTEGSRCVQAQGRRRQCRDSLAQQHTPHFEQPPPQADISVGYHRLNRPSVSLLVPFVQSIASWTGRLRPRFPRPLMLPSTRLEAATWRYVSEPTTFFTTYYRWSDHTSCSPSFVTLVASSVAVDQKVKIVAEAKIPKAADASKHKAGGGNVEICQLPAAPTPDLQ